MKRKCCLGGRFFTLSKSDFELRKILWNEIGSQIFMSAGNIFMSVKEDILIYTHIRRNIPS